MNYSSHGAGALPARSKQRLKVLLQTVSGLAILTASAALHPALAADATWNGTTSDWNTSTNWNPNTVPDNTANFSSTGQTTVTVTSGTNINQIDFLSGAQSYDIQPNGASLNINGTGVNNDSGVTQTFTVGGAGSALQFTNSAAITGSNVFINNQSGGVVYFSNDTDAGSVSINTQNGSQTQFFGNATANTATLTNANNSSTTFNNDTTAANATITNNNLGGTGFLGNSTAGNATITNNSGGSTTFGGDSTAANASITNNSGGTLAFTTNGSGGSSTIDNSGSVYLFNSGTLGGATVTNNSGGVLDFRDDSTAGEGILGSNATITNAGTIAFRDSSNSEAASITNNSGGTTYFQNDAYAGNYGTITNNDGGATIFQNSSIQTSTNSITNNDGGVTRFQDSSSASSIITNNSGGTTYFQGGAGGTGAFIYNNAGGAVDISGATTGTPIEFINGAGDVFLGSKTLTLGGTSNSNSFIYGTIQDGGESGGTGGSVVKEGEGTLYLYNANTYTGTTTVNNGTLDLEYYGFPTPVLQSATTINANGTLTGSGFISNTLTVNGTVTPTNSIVGDGRYGIIGSSGDLTLNGTSNYVASVGPERFNNDLGVSDVLASGGNAALNDGTLTVDAAAGTYGVQTRYGIVTASTHTGTFGTVDSSSVPSYLDTTVDYTDPNVVFLILTRNSTDLSSTSGMSQNQKSVANALDNNFDNTQTQFFPLYDSVLLAGSDAAARQALSMISGDAQTVYPLISQEAARRFLDRMRARALAQSVAGQQVAQADSRQARMAYTGTHYGTLLADASAAASTSPAAAARTNGSSSIWATVAGARDNGDSDGNGPGYEARATEYQIGYDHALNDRTLLGVSLGKSNGSVDINDRNAEGDFDTDSIGAYIRHEGDSFYAEGQLSYSRHDLSSERNILGGTASADFDARTWSIGGEVGKRYGKGSFSIEPNVSLRFSNTHQDDYSEDGPVGALNVDSASYNSRRLGLGVRLVSRSTTARFRPYGFVGYEREFGDDGVDLTNRIPGLAAFDVSSTELGKNIWTLRLGTDARISDRFSLVGEIGASWRKNQDGKYVYGGLKYNW